MIWVFTATAHVLRWTEPGKGPEIVNEMRLVIITAGACNVRPINQGFASNGIQDRLKAPNSAEAFRTQTDLRPESRDEMFLAHAKRMRDLSHPQSTG